MFDEYEKNKRKNISIMRSILDYGIGIVIVGFGVFMFFFRGNPAIALNETLGPPDALDKILGTMCLIYGTWRIYRGYKKNYFR